MLENDDKKEQKHYLTYTVTEEEEGETVRALLYEKLELSTRKIRALKRISGGILLDGHLVTVRETVKGGQSLQILLDDHCPSRIRDRFQDSLRYVFCARERKKQQNPPGRNVALHPV